MKFLRWIAVGLVGLACMYSFPGDVNANAETVYRAADVTYPVMMGAYNNLDMCLKYAEGSCAPPARQLVRRSVWTHNRVVNAKAGPNPTCARSFRAAYLVVSANLKLAASNWRRKGLYNEYILAAAAGKRQADAIKQVCLTNIGR